MGAASIRTMLTLMIMRADLDGDGAVTADELRRMLALRAAHERVGQQRS